MALALETNDMPLAQLRTLREAQEPATSSRAVDTENGRLELKETLGDLGMMLIEIEAV